MLEVNTKQAAELSFAADNGKVWLTLRPGQGTPPDNKTISEGTILSENPAAPVGGKP